MLPERIQPITDLRHGTEDGAERALVLFASPEERTLRSAQLAQAYRADVVAVLHVEDEANPERERNLRELRRLLRNVGKVHVIGTRHCDPLVGLGELANLIASCGHKGDVTVDVTTFPKNSLLLTLRAIELVARPRAIRVLYTEPERYEPVRSAAHRFGMRSIGVVPTFGARFYADQELVLVMLLGWERDRAVGIWQRVQPHRTVVGIGRPTFRPEWEGVTERVNAPMLAALAQQAIHYLDPRDPWATCEFLDQVVRADSQAHATNYYIAPLGTKPQTVGVYLFWRKCPDVASVVYGAPVAPQHQYIASGVGPTWVLTRWEVQ